MADENKTVIMPPINESAPQGLSASQVMYSGYEGPDLSNEYLSNTNTPKQSWYARNASWINPVVGALGTGLAGLATGGTAWIGALIGALGGLGTTWLQNKYNKDAYKQQIADQLAAENRANAEYDRRTDKANAYNEQWASRLRSEGINPLSYISKGQAGAMASSNPSSPSASVSPLAPAKSAQGIASALSIAEALASIKQTEAQTNLINAQATGQTNENESYWERFRASMDNLAATTHNVKAQTRINECVAAFKEATLSGDVQRAGYELQQAFYEMQRSGVSVDLARAELQKSLNVVAMQAIEKQLMTQQIYLNGQQMSLNDINYRQLYMVFEKNKALVEYEIQHQIDMMGETLRAAQDANDWYAFNQVVSGVGTIGNTVANVVNAFKPIPGVISTTTTNKGFNEDGVWSTLGEVTTTKTYANVK